MKTFLNAAFVLLLSANINAAFAFEKCQPDMIRSAMKIFSEAELVECLIVPSVVPAAQGGGSQVIVLINNNEDVTVGVFPTTIKNKNIKIVEMPLYVFSGLGEEAMEFEYAGKRTRLLIVDLDGDGLKEIGVLGLTQPNSLFTLKSYVRGEKRFSTYLFDHPDRKNLNQPIIVGPDEILKVPTEQARAFEVIGNEDRTIRRAFVLSKRLD